MSVPPVDKLYRRGEGTPNPELKKILRRNWGFVDKGQVQKFSRLTDRCPEIDPARLELLSREVLPSIWQPWQEWWNLTVHKKLLINL